ncbi:tetratricopeptide repeat protein 21B [Bicyclus anynana]|uniref:Tetratricopeptide repeat protein 21B-like n=2 Tax=Satyrini TaxID=127320 RepID=A0A6J1N9Y3_BICAN|nr:tetratricopeptide repeat protein 21B [Bicyclus anynana]XP_023941813.1 tetratricopeptide repeat protein 21B [Bicyclus anynana]XP_023941814.1 tetratricopeptide repeat protein 21B [Bicyclus anynana]XP_023941815.1 tetratricopeptide repeat protein 21B [Bicyclus anynana]
MDLMWYRCNVHYYLREKCYEKSKKICQEAAKKFTDTTEFLFFHGLANLLEGQVQKGINDLLPLQSERNIQFAILMALIYGHKLLNSYERDELYNLESKLKEEKKQANTSSFYYAGMFLSLAEKYEKASEYVNKSLRKDPNNLEAIVLKGYNDMYMNVGEVQTSILDCFELALQKSDRHIEAMLGLAKYRYFTKDYNACNSLLDKLIVNYPGQIVPITEKLKNEFAALRWDAVHDSLERVLSLEPTNLEALKVRIFVALCKHSDYIEAVDQLNTFFTVLENEEPNNGYQFYNTAQIFSKISGRSSAVLSQVFKFAQYASEMYSNNVDYLSEVGYQCILQGKYKDSLSFFKAASKVDSNSITALCGLTLCQMFENGPTDQIAQQVELLFEMQGTQKFPILYLLSAQLNSKNSNAVTFLNNAIDTQISAASRYPYSLSYIKRLDPDFLLEVYKEYKKHLPKKPFVIVGYILYTQEEKNTSVASCFRLLDTICKACPGLITALYELAKLKFLFGYATKAQAIARQIGDLDNTHAGSQVLLAQIYIQQGAFSKATQTLEMCLSYNFKIRDSVMYHFLNGIILKNMNQIQDALASFVTSLQILTSKNNVSRQQESDLNIIDKATLYLQIIELQTTLGQFGEAGKTMQEAIQEISYTSEESRLLIARADLALNKGDVDNAIEILNEVKPGQPYYFQAHTKMAHIYLKEKNDRAMFTSCYKDIVNNHPMADAHTMMGDAFMSIHEPIQAAESYETALKGNPKDIQLVKKLGLALVKMHEYDKAMQHYENAIRLLNDDELKFEYLELLIKLKQYDKVDSNISSELNQLYNKEKDVPTFKRRIRFLLTQARTRDLKNPAAGNTNLILTEAKDLQMAVLKRVEIDSRGDLEEEKKQLSSILRSLAKVKSVKEPAVAANLYTEALIHCPRDPATLLALAKLYAQMNNPERCEETCAVLLNADPNNESAAVMMADLAFRKVDFETAQRHLEQILSVKATSWEALAQLIEVQWRRGKLSEVEQTLETAKNALDSQDDPGYAYCSGLHSMYQGKMNAALRQLNHARRSPRWGQAAAKRMVLLCLSQHAPDALQDSLTAGDDSDTRLLALRTAEKLLAEVAHTDRNALQALLQLANKHKSQADKVLQEILPLATEDGYQDDPYLILAIANAYNIVKQPTRAKNILKRAISSIPWTPEKADGLERCWLEVADNQISSGRTEAAKEILTKILNHNSSCAAAYQYLGFLSEKDQNYKSAAHNYDNAWVHTGKSDLAIGYKLAYAYLKLKKYPECIVVSRHILKIRPEYPKLKKEILEKAKSNLRT